ncbi:MAG: ATP-grasp domain-containing protein [Treponema sp.]|nr:ATP-grasp domain-containing protein [Treponema sp.]
MKNIVFYSTNTNEFDGTHLVTRTMPSRRSEWDVLARAFPDFHFFVVTQLPGAFLLDVERNSVSEEPESVRYVVTEKLSPQAMAEKILTLSPDIAVAATFWVTPFDWLGVQDAQIADILRAKGVRTVCHSLETMLACFDKYQTRLLLEKHGFSVSKAVYIHHEQFWAERGHREVHTNAYKNAVLSQLEHLHYPVVVKDTVGLSSYGMEVAVSYKQALFYLFSGRTNGDRLVEEFIEGEQFGTEIYGTDGNYTVLPPCMFSVNRYGITSPKQSVKIGPITSERYRIPELQAMLQSLAKKLNLSGVAQVDLIFNNDGWHIIEINPRLSGMTETYAASLNTSVCRILTDIALGNHDHFSPLAPVLNFKIPICEESQLADFFSRPEVKYVHQIHNEAAKQEREKGYGEVVLRSDSGISALKNAFLAFSADYPALVDQKFIADFQKMKDAFEKF